MERKHVFGELEFPSKTNSEDEQQMKTKKIFHINFL